MKQEASVRRGPGSVRWYSCSKMGHYSWNCPEKALFCHSHRNCSTRQQADRTVLCSGFVEGKEVEDFVLDTGAQARPFQYIETLDIRPPPVMNINYLVTY